MKHFFLRLFCASCALLAVSVARASLSDQVSAANAAMTAGHPIEALETYKSLLASPEFANKGSSELWYNRGLAEEKNGNAAAASLSFRRALLLDPGFAPARRKLAADLGLLGLPAPSGWQEQVRAAIHPERLILAGAVVGWIGALTCVLVVIAGPRKKGLIAATLFLFILGHGVSIVGTFADPRRTAEKEAVVTAKEAPPLRQTPADSADSQITIPPGTLLTILSRNGAWWYVSAGPGLTGWISSDAATPLLPSFKGS
jgi:hypothetical protein